MRFFEPHEFYCKCGRDTCDALVEISPVLGDALDRIRKHVQQPMVVTSGLRCAFWNTKSGGQGPEHMLGYAADIAAPDSRTRFLLVEAAIKEGVRRIGIGKTFVHIGVSPALDPDVIWHYYPR